MLKSDFYLSPLWIAFFFLCTLAQSQEGRVPGTLDIQIPIRGVRSWAPIPIVLDIVWNGEITEGICKVEANAGRWKYTSYAFTLSPGKKRISLLLPILSLDTQEPFSIEVRYKMQNEMLLLGEKKLDFDYCRADRTMSVLSSHLELESDTRWESLLALDRFAPPIKTQPGMPVPLYTSVYSWNIRDFPASPLEYTPYNLVILYGELIDKMNLKQRDALLAWIKMGGSLFIALPEHTPCDNARLKFLNDLVDSDNSLSPEMLEKEGNTPVFSKDSKGEWITASFPVKRQSGLGRVAVYQADPLHKISPDSPECRNMAAFLWKLTKTQSQAFCKTGQWFLNQKTIKDYDMGWDERARYGNLLFSYKHHTNYSAFVKNILECLLPKNFTILSTWVLVLMLFCFLLVIGPVDYFVLGFFKKRHLTWIFFPLCTLLFLYATIALVNYQMGDMTGGKYVEIVDADVRGNILCKNRISIMLEDSSKLATISLQDSLWTEIHAEIESNFLKRSRNETGGRSENTEIHGHAPAAFTVTTMMNQWEPLFARCLSSEVKKEKIQEMGLKKTIAHCRSMMKADAFKKNSYEDKKILQELLRQYQSAMLLNGKDVYYTIQYRYQEDTSLILDGVAALSRREQQGFFSVVYQVSPSGAKDLEDLSILDPTDETQWLLIVCTKKNDNIIVYRILFYSGSAE